MTFGLLLGMMMSCSTDETTLPAGNPELKLTQLEWMVGRWLRDAEGGQSEEVWSSLSGGTMMGTNRTVKAQQTASFEFMQLQEGDFGVRYRAWPGGDGPTTFALTEVALGHAVFENPDHDFPKRVVYKRHVDTLSAEIYGDTEEAAASWSWTLAGSEARSKEPRVTGVGGVFFKSKDPEKVRAWYAEHLGFVTNEYGAMFEFRTVEQPESAAFLQWSPFSDATTYFQPSEREFMINYRVADLDGLLVKLKAAGVEQVGEVERTEYGNFAHVMDVERNKVELWEPVDAVFSRTEEGETTK